MLDAASPTSRRKVSVARLSVVSNTALTLMKLVVGLTTGSVSVLSEAAHSANDLVAACIAYFSVRVSDRPADAQHPYGHGKVESVSGLVEAALIFGAAAYIVYEAAQRLVHGAAQLEPGLGILVMTVSALTNVVVSRVLFRVADETDSLALRADAEHLRTDVVTSVGVVAGLGLVQVTKWYVVDPLIAIAVALLICSAAYRLTRDAMHGLLDAQLPDTDLQAVLDTLDMEPSVLAYHKLRTRKSGSSRHIDAHILVADNLSLTEAHALTEALEHRIRQKLPRTEVMLHTEPHDAEMLHQYTEHGGPKPT